MAVLVAIIMGLGVFAGQSMAANVTVEVCSASDNPLFWLRSGMIELEDITMSRQGGFSRNYRKKFDIPVEDDASQCVTAVFKNVAGRGYVVQAYAAGFHFGYRDVFGESTQEIEKVEEMNIGKEDLSLSLKLDPITAKFKRMDQGETVVYVKAVSLEEQRITISTLSQCGGYDGSGAALVYATPKSTVVSVDMAENEEAWIGLQVPNNPCKGTWRTIIVQGIGTKSGVLVPISNGD